MTSSRSKRVRRIRRAKEDKRDLDDVKKITKGIYGDDLGDEWFEDPDEFYYHMESIWYDVDGPLVRLIASAGAIYLTLVYAGSATNANLHGVLASMFFLATGVLAFTGAFDMWKRRPGGTVAQLIFPISIIVLAVYKSVQ